jgi:hypothetical protein
MGMKPDDQQINNGETGASPDAESKLAELLKNYKPGKPFPGGTMRVGRATKAKTTLVSGDATDRDLGI